MVSSGTVLVKRASPADCLDTIMIASQPTVLAEAPHLVQFDVGVLGARHDDSGDPPVGAGQARRQIRPGPGPPCFARAAGSGNHFTVSRLPQTDQAGFFGDHDGVVPPPDDHFGTVLPRGEGNQMARRHPLGAWRREGRRKPHRHPLVVAEDHLAPVLADAEHDAAAEALPRRAAIGWEIHSHSVLWRDDPCAVAGCTVSDGPTGALFRWAHATRPTPAERGESAGAGDPWAQWKLPGNCPMIPADSMSAMARMCACTASYSVTLPA